MSSLFHSGIWVTMKLSSGYLKMDWGKILLSGGLCGHSPSPFMVPQGTCCDGVGPLCPPTQVCRCYRWFRLFRAMLLAEKSDAVSQKGLHTCLLLCPKEIIKFRILFFFFFFCTGHVFMNFIFNYYCCCEHEERE